MNHLLARVNDRKEKYRKLLSGQSPFQKPENLNNKKVYSPAYKLEDDEWYVITGFSKEEYCIDLLKNKIDTTKYKQFHKIEAKKISYICSYQDDNEFYFQRIFKTTMLNNKRFLDIGDGVKIKEAKQGLVLNTLPDALYLQDEDCLYFKKLETVAPIFKGIDSLYRDATDEEISIFLQQDFIKLKNDYSLQKVGKSNRKRIALATDSLNKFNKTQQEEIFKYTNEYYPNLKYDGKGFEIKNDEDLKNLLYGIEQRFYTTPVTKERRVANSVEAV